MSKKLTQCEIHTTETNFESAIKEFEEANIKMFKSVESLINMIAKLDSSLFEFEEYMAINYIDGEMLYSYVVKTIEIEEDGTIIVNCDDIFDTEQTSFELDNLSSDEIRCLGSMLYDAYQKKYGTRMTYKQMIEDEKPLQTKEIKYICPSCGTEFTQGDWNYNYDSGLLDFECDCCGWTGTENQLNEE